MDGPVLDVVQFCPDEPGGITQTDVHPLTDDPTDILYRGPAMRGRENFFFQNVGKFFGVFPDSLTIVHPAPWSTENPFQLFCVDP